MTTIHLARAIDPTGTAVACDYRVRLIDADGNPVAALRVVDGSSVPVISPESGTLAADGDTPLSLDLIPNSQLIIPSGGACYWELALRATGRPAPMLLYRLIVPDHAGPFDLLDLLTTAIGGVGCMTLTCLTDGPGTFGTAGQALVVADDGETWDWGNPTAQAGWGAITGDLEDQTDLTQALSAKEATGTAAAAIAAHLAAPDPHSGYRQESAAVPWSDLSSVPSTFAPTAHAAAHAAAGSDPLTLTLAQLGQSGATTGQVPKWSGTAWAPADDTGGGEGGGATNLSVANKSSTTLDIASDTGNDATIPAADGTYAGLLTAAGFTKLSGIAEGATAAGATGDAFATSHLSAFAHGNIANGQTAYGWGNHASAGYLTSVTYGTTAGTACQGNDTRLSDARTPTSHDHASNKLAQANTHETPDTDTATTALHHTLGTGANQACAGNDSRLTNARAPTAHASTHATGQADALTPANIGAEPAQTVASQAEMEAGTETAIRSMSPVRVAQAVAARIVVCPVGDIPAAGSQPAGVVYLGY